MPMKLFTVTVYCEKTDSRLEQTVEVFDKHNAGARACNEACDWNHTNPSDWHVEKIVEGDTHSEVISCGECGGKLIDNHPHTPQDCQDFTGDYGGT